MGTATIEAVTNDALATIYELMTDVMPSECAGEPPWCYFRGRSAQPIARLLQRGSFAEKRTYVLGQVERLSGHVLEEQILKDIDRLVTFRNRIVHMSFQAQPGKYKPILNTAQMAHVAALAGDTVRYYLDFLSETFRSLSCRSRQFGHGATLMMNGRKTRDSIATIQIFLARLFLFKRSMRAFS